MYLGLDLGGTKTEIVALDASGRERLRERRATPPGDYEGGLETMAALVAEAEVALGPAASVGVGTPGAVVRATGVMKNCNSTWLNGRPLPADLAARLGRDVPIANDADCFALSEAVDGAGAGRRTVFGVILGTGVGGGIVHRGRLLAGPNAIAGEWGHNPLPSLAPAGEEIAAQHAALGSRACWCGRRDCVETWLSGPGLHRTWRALGGEGADAAALAGALAAGAPAARAALELYGWQLAAALATVVNVMDPDVIVLGGGVSKLQALYAVIPERWGAFVFSDEVATPLERARHGDSGGVRGAAWLGRDALPGNEKDRS
ncbi:MAG: ROK family protein [Pseudomonadales bacterium]|jgi:fructokinase|nr:ROK family protein [Pseudomonadales bacterium]